MLRILTYIKLLQYFELYSIYFEIQNFITNKLKNYVSQFDICIYILYKTNTLFGINIKYIYLLIFNISIRLMILYISAFIWLQIIYYEGLLNVGDKIRSLNSRCASYGELARIFFYIEDFISFGKISELRCTSIDGLKISIETSVRWKEWGFLSPDASRRVVGSPV